MLAVSRVARAYEFRSADGQILMRYEQAGQSSPSGWPASNMFHQPTLENQLRGVLAGSPLAEVRLGVTVTALAQDDAGVTATVSSANGDQTLRARWLVGCDGGRSTVRTACGIELSDYGFDEPWLVIDAMVHDASRLPVDNLQICDPARPTTCLVMSQGRHRWEFMLLPGEQPADVLDDGVIRDLLRPWNCEDCVEIERKAVYRFHGRVAERWRDGRVLLAGDAAHQTPPFAGQGMCSGLRDVDNLAWKLAAVILRGADPALLDSYQTEREPQVRSVIELAIAMGRVVCISDPQQAALRDAGMLAQRAAGHQPPAVVSPRLGPGLGLGEVGGVYFPQPWAGDLRLDDVLGEGPWLIVRGAMDGALTPFAAALDGWLEARDAEAVLVRPDRYVFGAGSPSALQAAWAERVA
jgi:3-(3-hydroxy-phenyl)propionate hydroxylase